MCDTPDNESGAEASSQMVALLNTLRAMPRPFVFCAGHTLGFFNRPEGKFQAVVPPYKTDYEIEASRLLGVGESPAETVGRATELANRLEDSYLCVLLNDTSNIPSQANDPSKRSSLWRKQLVQSFSDKQGLPDAFLKRITNASFAMERILHSPQFSFPDGQHEKERLFWTESSLRNRFCKLVQHPANKSFFFDKVQVRSEQSRRRFKFLNFGELDYCRLSPEPNSLTGGAECVAEVIEFCLEIFGWFNPNLFYQHRAIKNYRLKRDAESAIGGTFIIFYPAICREHVNLGLKFYKIFMSHPDFEWVSIPCTVQDGKMRFEKIQRSLDEPHVVLGNNKCQNDGQ